MKLSVHKLYIFVLVFWGLLFSSCHKGEDIAGPEARYKHTVIIYMAAENSLFKNASYDIAELKNSVAEIPSDCQIVIYCDDDDLPHWLLARTSGMITYKTYSEEQNSASPEAFRQTLQDIMSTFPSDTYSLVLWSHGSNWKIVNASTSLTESETNSRHKAILLDNGKNITSGDNINKGTWMDIDQLRESLEALSVQMTYIMFDACYMQSMEVAAELYKLTQYIIASPTEIPEMGAPYARIEKALCQNDIYGIVNGYHEYYGTTIGVPLSSVCTSEFPQFCTLTSNCIQKLFQRESMPTLSTLYSAQIYAPRYGSSAPYQHDLAVPYDIRSVFSKLTSTDGASGLLSASEYQTWETQWAKTILYPMKADRWATSYAAIDSWGSTKYGTLHSTMRDAEHFGGISFNIPQEAYSSQDWISCYHRLRAYTILGWDKTGW